MLLCNGAVASKTLQLQAFLTSALVSDKSFARQELFNLHAARRFAVAWNTLAENRFQFSCPHMTVPKLLHTVDEVVAGTVAVTNAATPSVIRLRIEGLKGEALARLLIEVWPQITKHVDHRAAMITITDKKVRVRSLPIAP